MNTEKDIDLHDADDTGICMTCIENEADDPATDIDVSGACVNRIEQENDDTAAPAGRHPNHIDASCEGNDTDAASFGSLSYQDPLGDVELGDADDTGICMHYIDTDIDDPETDVDVTGRGIEALIP